MSCNFIDKPFELFVCLFIFQDVFLTLLSQLSKLDNLLQQKPVSNVRYFEVQIYNFSFAYKITKQDEILINKTYIQQNEL